MACAVYVWFESLSLIKSILGACPSALQRAASKTVRASEEGGRTAARGGQSYGLVILREGGISHALHHTRADLCLGFKECRCPHTPREHVTRFSCYLQ